MSWGELLAHTGIMWTAFHSLLFVVIYDSKQKTNYIQYQPGLLGLDHARRSPPLSSVFLSRLVSSSAVIIVLIIISFHHLLPLVSPFYCLLYIYFVLSPSHLVSHNHQQTAVSRVTTSCAITSSSFTVYISHSNLVSSWSSHVVALLSSRLASSRKGPKFLSWMVCSSREVWRSFRPPPCSWFILFL